MDSVTENAESAANLSRREMPGLLGSGSLALTSIQTFRGETMHEAKKGKPSLATRLTREYGVRYPFVGAGMGFIALPELVAAVSNAGGIGVLGASPEPPPGLLNMIQATRSKTDKLFGIDFIHAETSFGPATTDAHIDVCVAERIKLVVFHWNPPLRRWVDVLHEAGARVWMQTGLVEHAMEAVNAGVDGLVAQGNQAGGHVKSAARTSATLKHILAAVPPSILVLAAGGIADGRAVVKALAHGAEGVWVGTRLIASTEAYAHPEYKRRLTTATGHATTTTTMFGPEWPNQPMRVLRNRVVKEWAGRESEIPTPPPPAVIGQTRLMINSVPGGAPYEMPRFCSIPPTPDATGDFEEMCLAAGEGVRVIKEIKPAAEIIAEMMEEARSIIETRAFWPGRLPSFLRTVLM